MSLDSNESVTRTTSSLNFSFDGQSRDLFFLVIKNIFLTLITLGIYYPWARNAKRKFMMQHLVLGSLLPTIFMFRNVPHSYTFFEDLEASPKNHSSRQVI